MPATKGKKGDKEKEEMRPILQKGVFIFPNGDKYDGEYLQLEGGGVQRSGHGSQTTNSGVCYCGHWSKDKMNGHGTVIHPSGSCYEGQFVDNQFHGRGIYKWPNGAMYEGEFVNNRLEGEGEYTDMDDQQWVGAFHNKAALGLRFMLTM